MDLALLIITSMLLCPYDLVQAIPILTLFAFAMFRFGEQLLARKASSKKRKTVHT